MGANLLCRYVEIQGENCRFKAQACMSAPYNLDRVTSGLKNSDKLLYDNALLDGAKNMVQKNYKLFKKWEKKLNIDVDYVLNKVTHIRDFDELMLPQVHGYGNDFTKFYYEISACHFMEDVKIPSLFIHSLDDPVCIKE